MTSVEIRNGDYHAFIILDKLAELSIRNIRKIFKLMKHAPASWIDEPANQAAIDQTGHFLRLAVTDAKTEWAATSNYCRDQWSQHTDRVAKARNRKLLAAVHKAKAAYDRLIRIQSIFNET